MKYIMLWLGLGLLMQVPALAQLTMDYIPEMPAGWDADKYSHGKYILEGSYTQLKEAGGIPSYVDYWNVAVAYVSMGQSGEVVQELLQASFTIEPFPFCELVRYLEGKSEAFSAAKGVDWEGFVRTCADLPAEEEEYFDLEAYAREGGYDIRLLHQLDTLMERDQRYRGKLDYSEHTDWVAQQQETLDPENLKQIAQLLEDLGEYPGADRVGPRFQHVACLVIEHAAPSDMALAKQLLPMVGAAYQANQVPAALLRMLIDRLHWLEHGTQIYGSHHGIPFAEADIRNAVKQQWELP